MSTPRPDWPTGTWFVVLVAAVVELLASFVGAGLVSFAHQGICSEPASVEDLWRGRWELLAICVVGLLPWLLAAVRNRRWLRMVLLGLVATAPALLITVQAWVSSAEDWTIDWCVF